MSQLTPSAANVAAPPVPGEGCPTPLAWQEVLESFRLERDEFALPTSWGDVHLWEFGAGTPLTFLGDAAGDAELFALTAWLLREQFRCCLITLPNPPSQVARQHWLPGAAALLNETLAARLQSSHAIYGVGYGGLVALQAALDAPQSVDRLILQGCLPGLQLTLRERFLFALGRRWGAPLGSLPGWNRVIAANHRRWFPPFDDNRWEFLRQNLAATPTRRFAACVTAGDRPALAERLQDVAAPVLIIRTEGEGRRATDLQEQLAAQLPQARVEWMHTTGQFPYVTHPHRLVKLIREFVSPQSPASTIESPVGTQAWPSDHAS